MMSIKGLKSLQNQLSCDQVHYVTAQFTHEKKDALREYDTASADLLGQKIIRTKNRGVEPGFIAKKQWTQNDHKKLLNPEHKFHKEALLYCKEQGLDNFEANSKGLIEHLQNKFLKFNKEHWWKLHYRDPSGKKVMVDRAQAWNYFHQHSTAETPRDKNIGAVMEALANDLFNLLEFGGQKLSLKLSKYQSGYPMLLLDGTQVMGPNGEPFRTLAGAILKGPKCQGRIKDNLLPDPKTGELVPIDESKLGSAFAKALLLGDRDKVGTNGDNIGYVVIDGKAVLMNIDPGKSFEMPKLWRADRMIGQGKKRRDIGTDCLFDRSITPKDLFTKSYPNFSIFNDTPYAARMQGIKDIKEKWPQIVKLFDAYIAFFKEHEAILDPQRPANAKAIHEELAAQFERLKSRAEMFFDVFKERLELSPEQLTVLDNLEKLTSPTTKCAKLKKGQVELKHLEIVKPRKNRREWAVDKRDGSFTFKAKNEKSTKKTLAILKAFEGFIGEKIIDKGRVTISLDSALQLFSEQNIINFKS